MADDGKRPSGAGRFTYVVSRREFFRKGEGSGEGVCQKFDRTGGLADDGKRCQAQGVVCRVPEAAELDDLSYSKRGGSPRGERVVPGWVP